MELKYGDAEFCGKSGITEHFRSIKDFLSGENLSKLMIDSDNKNSNLKEKIFNVNSTDRNDERVCEQPKVQ
jgi:hypothetical protein